MKIYTNKQFEEELNRRMNAAEENALQRERFHALQRQIDDLRHQVGELRRRAGLAPEPVPVCSCNRAE